MQGRFVPGVAWLLDSYASFITEEEDPMAKSARELIAELLADPACRKAVALIQAYVPKLRPWITDALLPELEKTLKLPVQLKWAYPNTSENPHEIDLDVGELNATLRRKGALSAPHEGVYFMLKSGGSTRGPVSVGDSFDVLVMVFGAGVDRRRNIISALGTLNLPPESRAHRQWGPWTCLWAGQSYALQDIGAADARAIATLVQAAVSEIYPLLVQNL